MLSLLPPHMIYISILLPSYFLRSIDCLQSLYCHNNAHLTPQSVLQDQSLPLLVQCRRPWLAPTTISSIALLVSATGVLRLTTRAVQRVINGTIKLPQKLNIFHPCSVSHVNSSGGGGITQLDNQRENPQFITVRVTGAKYQSDTLRQD